PYYGRFGFKPSVPGTIAFPGPVDAARLLVLELEKGALADASGPVRAYTA
ncbi:MAG: N-acetyltransferase, partial [Pseudomonadota bacterium]